MEENMDAETFYDEDTMDDVVFEIGQIRRTLYEMVVLLASMQMLRMCGGYRGCTVVDWGIFN